MVAESTGGRPVRGAPPAPTAGEVLAGYLHAHATEFLRSLRLQRESGSDAEEAVEAGRRLRRSARRISGALHTFRPLTDTAWSDPLRAELAWVAGTLAREHAYAARLVRLRAALHRLSGADPSPVAAAGTGEGGRGATEWYDLTGTGTGTGMGTGGPGGQAYGGGPSHGGGQPFDGGPSFDGAPAAYGGDGPAVRPLALGEAELPAPADLLPTGSAGYGADSGYGAGSVADSGFGTGSGTSGNAASGNLANGENGERVVAQRAPGSVTTAGTAGTGVTAGAAGTPGKGGAAGGQRRAQQRNTAQATATAPGALTVGAARAAALLDRQLTLARTRAHSQGLQVLGSSRFHAVADSVAVLASEAPLDTVAAAGSPEEALRPLADQVHRRLADAVDALPLYRAGHPYNAEALVHGLAATAAADAPPAAEQQDAPWHQVRLLLRLCRYAEEVMEAVDPRPVPGGGDEPPFGVRLSGAAQALERHRDAAEAAAAAAAAARTPRIAPATAYALGVLHADQRHDVEAARFAFGRLWQRWAVTTR